MVLVINIKLIVSELKFGLFRQVKKGHNGSNLAILIRINM